jgi:tRNA/tmRNA/rRNA uracil-C5-methylase (TrmA/RlmC/RlmD family)
VAEAMYARAVAELRLAGGECVVDAHSGVGAIGLWAKAAGAGRVVGFETVPAAVEDARSNARLNALEAEFLCGPAETLYPARFAGRPAPDGVVLDPPRAGAAAALVAALRDTPPKRLVYVSCSPETLARDLRHLTADGRFRLERVVPVDLFPQTAHLEAIAVLAADATDGNASGA